MSPPVVVQLLVILATAFLTVGLGGVPPTADVRVRVAFIAAAAVSFGLAAAWQSRRFREWLPVRKPWVSRLNAIWEEGFSLRESLPVGYDAPDDEIRAKLVDWDQRMWKLVADEIGSRAEMYKVNYGGALETLQGLSNNDIRAQMQSRLDFVQGLAHGTIR